MRSTEGRRARWTSALATALSLGLGAGTGAMLGAWAGIAWWIARNPARKGGRSMLPVLAWAGGGVLIGGIVGALLAALLVMTVGRLRRGDRRPRRS